MAFRHIKIILIALVLISCTKIDQKQIDQAKKLSDKLLDDIAVGHANAAFSEQYFPSDQTKIILSELKNKCDFANRKGNFVNDFYESRSGYFKVHFIYEYYLKCDSVRIITSYNLNDKIELYSFKIEGLGESNFMILKPDRQLKH
ncbi:MAG: hypothetical protein DAHOPDDO_00829 [Ignavibacteriaceae bacterium]|nr:hypothetical protein [Ignavibacteriaceae bacterium]